MSPDLAGRKLLVAAYCYYVLDQPVISDGEYDALTIYVCENWKHLDPCRKWAMVSAPQTYASGSHFKYTTLTVDCARSKVQEKYKSVSQPYPENWSNGKYGRYVTAGDY